jgi:hypothetical protein
VSVDCRRGLSGVLSFPERNRGASGSILGPVVDALPDDLADVQEHTRAPLADMQERLELAERLLTAGRTSRDEKSE